MKFRRKLYVTLLVFFVALFLYGWMTSTRYVDMKFLEDGVPLSKCELHMISDYNKGKPEIFNLNHDGEVRISGSYAGTKAIFAIKRGDEVIREVYEPAFERGITEVNFRLSGIESTHRYRFLFYESTTKSKSINLLKDESEQVRIVQPTALPGSDSQETPNPKLESEGSSQ